MSNAVILLKWRKISPNIAPRGSECENNLQEVMAWESFHMLNLTFDPFFKVKWGRHTKMPLFHPYYWCYGFRI